MWFEHKTRVNGFKVGGDKYGKNSNDNTFGRDGRGRDDPNPLEDD